MKDIIFVEETGSSTYPCLKKDIRSDLVVLFTSEKSGVVVTGNKRYKKGDSNNDWISANNSKEWVSIHGKVEFNL